MVRWHYCSINNDSYIKGNKWCIVMDGVTECHEVSNVMGYCREVFIWRTGR